MTIKDIARESGVAVGTVSRVLNNQDYVSKATREKVLEVVNKYGFELNQNAKELKARGSRTIVIIVNGASSILLNSLLETIQSKLEKLPYNTNVVTIDELDNEVEKAYNIYCEKKPLGIIFLGGNPERFKVDFEKIQVPCILVSTQAENQNYRNLSSVSTDDYKAMTEMTEYFIKKGHKKIGLISGDLNSMVSNKRFRAFRETLELAGLNFDFDKSFACAKYSFEGGASACEDLLKKNSDLTAIIAMSDVMAIGACRKLKDLGYSVPDQISVSGFDGLPISNYYCPKITTIKQRQEELADVGVKALINCIEKKMNSVHKLVPYEFVEGESVKTI